MRLVDADKLKQELKKLPIMSNWGEAFMPILIDEQPTVEAVPVVHGEWIKESMGMRKNINTGELVEKFHCDCSICGYHTGNQGTRFNFCPNCGSDMRKKVQE